MRNQNSLTKGGMLSRNTNTTALKRMVRGAAGVLAGGIALLSAQASTPVSTVPPPSEWIGTASGLWTNPLNWSGPVPNASSDSALFGTVPGVPISVTLNGGKTLGSITFNNSNSYTILDAGVDALTLNNGVDPSFVSVLSGTHRIAADVVLGTDTSATAAPGSSLIFDGEISGSKAFTTSGTVKLTSPTSYTGQTRVLGGTLALEGDASFDGSTSLVVDAPANLNVENLDGLFGIQASQSLLNNGSVRGHVDVFGTLTGAGLQDGLVYLADQGRLAPGNGVGVLRLGDGLELSNGSIFDFQLGSSSDLILITGGSSVGSGTGGVTVNLSPTLSFAPGQYVLMDWTGTDFTGIEATDFVAGTLPPAMGAEFVIVGETLRVNVVPEPGSLLMTGIGALALTLRRRRS